MLLPRRIVYVACFCLFIAFATVSNCLAGGLYWESVPLRTYKQKVMGLAGGEGFQQVYAIAYAPSDASMAYFSTDTSQVWKSINGGFSWEPKNHGFVSHGARSILVDPRNPAIVFAAGFSGVHHGEGGCPKGAFQGIYRTRDGGDHWVCVKRTDFFKQESKGSLFAFDSSTFKSGRTWTIFAGSYSEGLICSDDGGDTWRAVGFQGEHIIDMEENPAKAGALFIATEDGLYTYFKGRIRRIGRRLPAWPRSIAVSPAEPTVIYAAVGKGGVYKSIDGGVHFRPANEGLPFGLNFTDVAASPVNPDIVYVKADKSSSGPFYSSDGAKHWHAPESRNLGGLLPDEEGFWFSTPFAPHPKESRTALIASNGRARVLKTLDGGKAWGYSGSGFTGGRMRDIAFSKDGKMVFCLTDHGLWMTEDGGDTFRELKARRVFGAKSSYSGDIRGNTIVASLGTWGEKGLAVSHDLGKSWRYFGRYVDRYDFIGFHPQYDNTIYAGPYRSRDSGNAWHRLSHTIRAVYSGNGDIVYAVSTSDKKTCSILKSMDQGDTWLPTYPASLFPEKSVHDVAVAPDNPDRIYLATSTGLWIFDKTKWILRNADHGLENDFFGMCYISSVAVDPHNPNQIYAGRRAPGCGKSNGVFRSLDYGLTWENITYNLGPELTVWAVEISPLDSTVYLGTSLGTFRLKTKK